MKKYQTNPNSGTFYKIIGLYSLKCQGCERLRLRNYFRLKKTKETQQIKCNAMSDFGLDPVFIISIKDTAEQLENLNRLNIRKQYCINVNFLVLIIEL